MWKSGLGKPNIIAAVSTGKNLMGIITGPATHSVGGPD